jgi:hypothetical protein
MIPTKSIISNLTKENEQKGGKINISEIGIIEVELMGLKRYFLNG